MFNFNPRGHITQKIPLHFKGIRRRVADSGGSLIDLISNGGKRERVRICNVQSPNDVADACANLKRFFSKKHRKGACESETVSIQTALDGRRVLRNLTLSLMCDHRLP